MLQGTFLQTEAYIYIIQITDCLKSHNFGCKIVNDFLIYKTLQ